MTSVLTLPRRLAGELVEHGVRDIELLVVLGSGLGSFADELEDPLVVNFTQLESMPASSVPGHAGRFVVGTLEGRRVACQQGRVHLYEGWSAFEVTRAVRAFAELGTRGLLLTNAGGGLVPDWTPPLLMRVTDHVNFQGVTPLLSHEVARGTPYDPELGELLDQAAREAGVALERGVYLGLPGPSYETPAEVRLFMEAGAHAVGMSTVCEALAAHASGMAVAGLSCISNAGAGLSPTPLDHDEVLEAGRAVASDFARLVRLAVPRLAAAVMSPERNSG